MRFKRFSASAMFAVLGLAAVAGCEERPGARDAAPQTHRFSEVAVRLDSANGATPSVSVLAYRASTTGVGAEEVLSVVDPVVADPPETGCALRDVAGAARTLGAQGDKIELEALTSLTVDLGSELPVLHPSPRVYPDLASVVGGVVGEAGPLDLRGVPAAVSLTENAGSGGGSIVVPGMPRLQTPDGFPFPARAAVSLGSDLVVSVTGPGIFIELRPFGATAVLACRLGPGGRVTVPAGELARLAQGSGQVPVSLEAVARESHPLALAGGPARLTLEVRASSVIELRP